MTNKKKNILLLGSGAREHNFALLITKSLQCKHLFVAPGNVGTAKLNKVTNLPIEYTSEKDFQTIRNIVREHNIDIVLIGPEVPLVDGLVNFLLWSDSDGRLVVIGPYKEGARLEGSKNFAKEIMQKYNIPTAKSRTFDHLQRDEAMAYLSTISAPYVLKIDGLAAGKGVIITSDFEDAKQKLTEMFSGKFGKLNKTVVIEEFLKGIELSVICMMFRDAYIILPTSKDYKQIGEGNTGPNTGGMGAISPVPFADEIFMQKVEKRIIDPMIKGLSDEHIDYCGFMYFGLMNVGGDPYVIEINCRMGDPEASVILPNIKTDFVTLMEACYYGYFKKIPIEIDNRPCATIVLVSDGYPGDYKKGKLITGLDRDYGNDIIITHAGTREFEGKIFTNSGRVLDITAFADNLPMAVKKCKMVAEQINFEGKQYRKDIGFEFIGETHNYPAE